MTCKLNRNTLYIAIERWMLDKKYSPITITKVPIKDLARYFEGEVPACPSGGKYTLMSNWGCNCSIHFDVEEDEYEE